MMGIPMIEYDSRFKTALIVVSCKACGMTMMPGAAVVDPRTEFIYCRDDAPK